LLTCSAARYITPAAAISFMFYEQFKTLLQTYITGDKSNRNSNFIFKHPAVPLVAGSSALLTKSSSSIVW